MAIRYWVGLAESLADVYRAAVTTFTPGTVLTITINARTVSYTCVTGETAASAAAALVDAIGSANDPRLSEVTAVIDNTDATRLFFSGPANGAPLSSPSVSAGITLTHTQTGTGPNYADNTANYNGGSLPSATDTLVFTGLTATDGPQHALTALAAIALTAIEVRSDYAGSIGLPDVSVFGYSEFRTKTLSANAALITVQGNGAETDQRLRFLCLVTNTTVRASGAGATFGVFPLTITGTGTGSSLYLNGYGCDVSRSIGETSVLATVDTVGTSALRLSNGVTATTVVLRDTTALIECTFATLTMYGESNAIALVGAVCSTGSGTPVVVQSGTLDWRTTVVPGPTIVLGSGATLITSNAVGPITSFDVDMYAGSTLDDSSGRITLPQDVRFVRCFASDVVQVRPPNLLATWDV